MAINTRTNSGKTGVFLAFVPLLGGLFIDNEDTRAAIKLAREASGAQQKDGYQGYKGTSASAKALAFLKEKGIQSVASVAGVLRGIAYNETVKDGVTYRRVFVTLRDNGESYTLKLDASNPGTHKLLQKLANVTLNETVEISVFGSYKPNAKDPAGPSYTDYAASVKTAAGEVKVAEGAWNAVNEVVKGLETQLAAIPGMSKEAVSTATRTAKTNYFAEMAKTLGAEMASAREAVKADGHTEPEAALPVDDDEPF
ncbi:MAG: hypothetical protein PHQ60_02220 [Sideroxydans sp.]|nr:hypothetical protein [Sideroxydans sp.]MDD5056659.1 hypothetical protein [Sideroxydans sp.]